MKIFICVLFLFTVDKSIAATYYFSSTAGDDNRSVSQAKTIQTPWKTLEKLNKIASMLKGGDSILFKSNDVWSGFTLEPNCNGLIIGKYGMGANPVIDGGVNEAVIINAIYCQGIEIFGLEFRRTARIGGVANLGNAWSTANPGMRNCRIHNCNFRGSVIIQGSFNSFDNNVVDGSSNDGNGNGIWEHHKYCHHNQYKNNSVSNFSQRGFWSMIETHDCTFDKNVIHHCKLSAIDLDGADYLVYAHTVKNNEIYNISVDAIELENAFECLIQGNYLYNGGRAYIYIINYAQCKVVDNHGAINGIGAILKTTIIGNTMIGGGIDFTSVAMGVHRASGISFFNNSVFNFKTRFFDLDYLAKSEVRNIKLVNNIFSAMQTQSWYAMVNFSSDEQDILEQDDYNCFYNFGRGDIYSNRVSHKLLTLAQYQAANHRASHSFSIDPKFVSSIDLKLQKTSKCIDAGLNVGYPYLGKSPDIGANEYSSVNVTIVHTDTSQLSKLETVFVPAKSTEINSKYFKQPSFSIYPNPIGKDCINVRSIEYAGRCSALLYDQTGNLVLTQNLIFKSQGDTETIIIKKYLSMGTYLLKLKGLDFAENRLLTR